MKVKNKCKLIRAWLYKEGYSQNKNSGLFKPTIMNQDWVQSHIVNCSRCQNRIAQLGKVALAFSTVKSQPHNLNLLMRANTQTIRVLRHSLRYTPKAAKLKTMLPEPKLLEKYSKYAHPAANAAACIAMVVLMKIGIFSTMDKFQTEGQRLVKQYYVSQLGEHLAEDIFNQS